MSGVKKLPGKLGHHPKSNNIGIFFGRWLVERISSHHARLVCLQRAMRPPTISASSSAVGWWNEFRVTTLDWSACKGQSHSAASVTICEAARLTFSRVVFFWVWPDSIRSASASKVSAFLSNPSAWAFRARARSRRRIALGIARGSFGSLHPVIGKSLIPPSDL